MGDGGRDVCNALRIALGMLDASVAGLLQSCLAINLTTSFSQLKNGCALCVCVGGLESFIINIIE